MEVLVLMVVLGIVIFVVLLFLLTLKEMQNDDDDDDYKQRDIMERYSTGQQITKKEAKFMSKLEVDWQSKLKQLDKSNWVKCKNCGKPITIKYIQYPHIVQCVNCKKIYKMS
jgi:RNA polymerase-binding transcription factor DksA